MSDVLENKFYRKVSKLRLIGQYQYWTLHLSSPDLDALPGYPQCEEGSYIIHPDEALKLLDALGDRAWDTGDLETFRKVKRRQGRIRKIMHIALIKNMLARIRTGLNDIKVDPVSPN